MTARARHRIFVGKDVHKFSSAHMTVFPDGRKERLHGHNFQVEVALDLRSIAYADFVDFGLVKRAMQEQCDAWTERLLLAARNPHHRVIRHDSGAGGELEFSLCGKRYVVPAEDVVLLPVDNIVVETLAAAFAEGLVSKLGDRLRPEVVLGLEVTVSESARQGGTAYLEIG